MICKAVPEDVAPLPGKMNEDAEIAPPVRFKLVEDLPAEGLSHVLCRAQRHTDVGHRVMAYYLNNMQQRGLYQVLGFASAVHFAEKRMGMEAPHARQLSRVGCALGELPLIDRAFADGRICWTAVRLLCTIAVSENEKAWLERALALSTRALEREVRSSEKGSPPRKERKGLPEVRLKVEFKLDPLSHEAWEQAKRKLEAEEGRKLTPADFARIVSSRVLQSLPAADAEKGPQSSDSIYRVAVQQCPSCSESVVLSDDGPVPLDQARAAAIRCDAGTLDLGDPCRCDGATSQQLPHGKDDPTPPWLRKKVLVRDGYRCQHCGSHEEFHVHHIIWRQHGGRSIAKNCITLCIRCHTLVHAGQLRVSGTAPNAVEFRDAQGRRLDGVLELPQPGDITVTEIPTDGTRVPSDGAPPTDEELRIENLPSRIDPTWWSRHEHLFTRDERRKVLELVPGYPQEPPKPQAPAASMNQESGAAPRPATLAAFVGQERVVQSLEIAVQAARARGEPLDHVLLEGGPGLGKTSLARALASAMEGRLRITSGPALEDPSVLWSLLTSLGEGDLLFIDEIHALPRKVAEMLYEAMEDRTISLPVNSGNVTRTLTLELRPFTLLAATTDPDRVPKPLRERFGLQETLEPYTEDELATIIERSGARDGLSFEPAAVQTLARAALGAPRRAIHLHRRVRDLCTARRRPVATTTEIAETLCTAGIDERGLGPLHRKALTLLASRARPLATRRLASQLGISTATLRNTIEPDLERLGLITATPRGLTITPAAR